MVTEQRARDEMGFCFFTNEAEDIVRNPFYRYLRIVPWFLGGGASCVGVDVHADQLRGDTLLAKKPAGGSQSVPIPATDIDKAKNLVVPHSAHSPFEEADGW
jgi:hypothetical protein